MSSSEETEFRPAVVRDDALAYRLITKRSWIDEDGQVSKDAFLLRNASETGISVSIDPGKSLQELESSQGLSKCKGAVRSKVLEVRLILTREVEFLVRRTHLDVINDSPGHHEIQGIPFGDNSRIEVRDEAERLALALVRISSWHYPPR